MAPSTSSPTRGEVRLTVMLILFFLLQEEIPPQRSLPPPPERDPPKSTDSGTEPQIRLRPNHSRRKAVYVGDDSPSERFLCARDVMARYGLKDRRATYRVMRDTGRAIVRGGRLVVPLSALVAAEEADAARLRAQWEAPPEPTAPRARRKRQAEPQTVPVNLPADWREW